jgi:hypothetical protein
MGFDKDKVFSKAGFPDHLTPDELKIEDEFGLQMAKAIEYEWFYRPEKGPCGYYDKRDKYHNLRLYARGEQSTKLYKDLLNNGEDTSYANYDWRPLQIVPKFVKLIVNQMTERLFDVKAEAVDKYSTDLKDTHKKNLEYLMLAKPAHAEAMKQLNIDLRPQDNEEYPETQEEIDLFMKLKYKPAIEIAAEEAIKFTLDLNDYDETQSRVIEDITTLGLAAIKHNTDPSKGIQIEYVDPADLVYSYPTHRDFKDVHYYGEVKRITIMELKRISNGKIKDDDLKDIAKASSEWSSHHSTSSNQNSDRDGDMGNTMVDVLFFNFKSINTLSYKKKYTRGGGFKMTEKESTFTKHDPSHEGYDAVNKIIDVWYEGCLVLGTNILFNYKLCENMIRPEGYLNITSPNYLVYAPELYQNRTRSLVERIIPYVDEMQQIHIKLQQIIAKARPNGIYIDVAGLNEITLGDGNVLTPLEAIKIYDETGNVIGTSLTHEGDFNYGREPIKELKNGVIDGLDRLINAYNHYLNLLRDAIGIPQGADASAPHPDMAVGVQQQIALNSNTATRHILDGGLNISERLGKGLALRLKDIFLYSDLRNTYINAIGKINVKILEALQKYHLHDLGINILLKPDNEERQYLENNITRALDNQLITLDDAIDIRNINNTKLANELLKTRRVRREKAKIQHEKDMEQQRAEGQAMVAERAAQAKQMELQAKAQFDLAIIEAKSKAKMNELEKEGLVKSTLMEKEFEYNVTLQQGQVRVDMEKSKYMEDRKDKRQDRGNSQDSKKIEQRTFNKPAMSFESSEDNISGNIEMGELGPS